MKTLLWLALALVLGLSGCVVTGPYRTVQHIKHAVKTRDVPELNEYVDFPVLRQNLKDQASTAITERSGLDGPFASVAAGIASIFTGGLIDYFITPQGLAKLMSGDITSLANPPETTEEPPDGQPGEPKKPKEKLFRDARYVVDSVDQVSVWAKDRHDKESRFVLTRKGLKWKLTNIILADLP